VDGVHASISHKNGFTSLIFRNDGTLHSGESVKRSFGLWGRNSPGEPWGVTTLVDRVNLLHVDGFRIGDWNFGVADGSHASMGSIGNIMGTAEIFRSDGNLFNGPRSDFNLQTRQIGHRCNEATPPTQSPTQEPTKSATHPVGCQSWCEPSSRDWATKCEFNACFACGSCADHPGQLKPGGQFCAHWCPISTRPWTTKCTFERACADCVGC
jgi:hypothetical protein